MRYLPGDSVSDEFWKGLKPQVESLLKDTPILRSRSELSLYLPQQLGIVRADMYDQHREPLFADLEDEIYLSPKYTASDLEHLRSLGIRRVALVDILDRAQADLQRSNSKIKAITTDDDWHTRASKLLSRPFNSDNRPQSLERIKSLRLIPLHGDSWVSTKSLPIYLPKTGNIPVPTDLGLKLVQSIAVANTSRKKLFVHLGVEQCVPHSVISLLVRKYSRGENITRMASISHLQYLYWNLPEDVPVLDSKIWLYDQLLNKVHPSGHSKEYIYFEDPEEEYGPQQLFRSINKDNQDAPGYFVHFLNAAYLQAIPDQTRHDGRSWKSWLKEFAGVRQIPQLCDTMDSALSDEFNYIIKYRPEKLVGLLKQHWPWYEPQMAKVLGQLCTSMVPSERGSMVKLGDSYLPLPKLKTITKKLHITDFPFILLPRQLGDQDRGEWGFLKQLGAGVDDNLDFYVEALERIADANPTECSPDTVKVLFRVYGAIQKNCCTSEDISCIQWVLPLTLWGPILTLKKAAFHAEQQDIHSPLRKTNCQVGQFRGVCVVSSRMAGSKTTPRWSWQLRRIEPSLPRHLEDT